MERICLNNVSAILYFQATRLRIFIISVVQIIWDTGRNDFYNNCFLPEIGAVCSLLAKVEFKKPLGHLEMRWLENRAIMISKSRTQS